MIRVIKDYSRSWPVFRYSAAKIDPRVGNVVVLGRHNVPAYRSRAPSVGNILLATGSPAQVGKPDGQKKEDEE